MTTDKVFQGYRMRWLQLMPVEHNKGCGYPNCAAQKRERGEFSADNTTRVWGPSERDEVQRICDVRNQASPPGNSYYDVEEVWRTPTRNNANC